MSFKYVVREGITEKPSFENSFEGSDGMSPREIRKWKNNCGETEGRVSVAGVEGTWSVTVRLLYSKTRWQQGGQVGSYRNNPNEK